MSNRRRQLTALVRDAQAWDCPDCPSDTGQPWLDADGLWHLPIRVENSCPGLLGLTPLPVAFLELPLTDRKATR